jgi:hypothetical protein
VEEIRVSEPAHCTPFSHKETLGTPVLIVIKRSQMHKFSLFRVYTLQLCKSRTTRQRGPSRPKSMQIRNHNTDTSSGIFYVTQEEVGQAEADLNPADINLC